MSKNLKEHLAEVVVCLLYGVVFWFAAIGITNQLSPKQGETKSNTTKVTLIDTVPYYKPVPKDSLVVKYITEQLPIANDTTQDHIADASNMVDSIEVQLPIEQKRYADSTYTAYVSGYKPRLDSIFIYPRQEVLTVTKREKHKRWSIGIHAGYGAALKGEPQLSPYIGIGVSYSFFHF